MQRLIDADALMEKAERMYDRYSEGHAVVDAKHITSAPAIDQVKWIPVSERLPMQNMQVLTFSPKYALEMQTNEYCGYYGEDDGEWHECWENRDGDVTHWTPLPEPPKMDGDAHD